MSEKPVIPSGTPKPARLPLYVPVASEDDDGTLNDGYRVVQPGDPAYADAYTVAADRHRYGVPMPYADQRAR